MKTTIALSLLLLSNVAAAQPRERIARDYIPASTGAVEITVGGTLQQLTGSLSDARGSMSEGPGVGGEVAVGYRLTPNLTLGAYGTLAGFSDTDADDVATWSAGAYADWHFRPATSFDPWIRLGVGPKAMWSGERAIVARRLAGGEARLAAGVDYRVSPSFAIGPVIGVDAAMYTHEDTVMTRGYEGIRDKDTNYTFTAGLQGRFDFFSSNR